MRQEPTPLAGWRSHTVSLPLWAPLLAVLTLVAILGLTSLAQAATVPPVGPLLAAAAPGIVQEDEEGEEEVDAEELEACEEAEEEGGECAEETRSATGQAPETCMLKSTEATVLVLPAKDIVRVTLRYTTFSPAVVNVQYSLRGRKGGLKMGADSRRFSSQGVLRETEKLTEGEMAKAKAATEFDLRVRPVNAPGYCRDLFDRKLTAKRSANGGLSWTESKSHQRSTEAP